MTHPIPPLVPYLTVRDARAALDFLGRAFGAETVMIQEDDSGVFHARAAIAGGLIMMYEEKAGAPGGNLSPAAYGGSPVALRVDLGTAENVDFMAERAVKAGGTLKVSPTDRPWGRLAEICDPDGHIWRLAASNGSN